jgi:DNA-binding response OmpR family regulator
MAKILLVEDDPMLSNMVRTYLVFEHHAVEHLANGAEANRHLRSYEYDLILLDWELPGMNGPDICRDFRATGKSTPVLMLTGKTTVDHKITGLDAGADDYLTKPFSMPELGARVRALLRRPATLVSNIVTVGDLSLDTGKFKVTKNSQPVQLLPREFQLLEFMMRHPNQYHSAEALLNHVWPSDSEATVEALKSTLKRMRSKIDPDGVLLKTVRGVGYSLDSP